MSVFNVFDPLQNVTLQFTEEQLADFIEWFDSVAKPILTINEGDPINVITIEQLMDFLKLKKLHRRHFHYPSYGEIMKEAENLRAEVLRVLTKEQFLYIINKYVINAEIKHELMLAFKVFDTEERNELEIDEIRTIVTTIGDIFTEEECLEMLRDANVNGDGNVSYEDFVESMFNVAPELYQLKTDYLYEDADEDPSVPPEPEPEPEPEPVVKAAPPPPPPAKGKEKGKDKGKKK